MRAALAAIALLVCTPTLAALTVSPDASDMWWNPDEPGWGVNIVQQADVLFATFFIYGNDGHARWYVAPETRCPVGTPRDMYMYCRGPLYETTGPLVRTPSNAGAVNVRQVGEVLFEWARSNSMNLTYTIDGVTVGKRISRQTWAVNNLSGEYIVTRSTRPSPQGCKPDVVTNEPLGTMTVTQSATSITLTTRLAAPPVSCTYSGTFAQQGRMGEAAGNYACSDGTSGPFSLREIEASSHGFLAEMFTTLRGCAVHGHLAGVRASVEQVPD